MPRPKQDHGSASATDWWMIKIDGRQLKLAKGKKKQIGSTEEVPRADGRSYRAARIGRCPGGRYLRSVPWLLGQESRPRYLPQPPLLYSELLRHCRASSRARSSPSSTLRAGSKRRSGTTPAVTTAAGSSFERSAGQWVRGFLRRTHLLG